MHRATDIAIILAVLLVGAVSTAAAPPVAVELYTSQNCSSCLPADRLLDKLSRENGIVALSFPVDYWDILGWKDTLANKDNTARQKAYAGALGRGGVYTPQIIVDGRTDAVGNRIDAVEAAVRAAERGAAKSGRIVPVFEPVGGEIRLCIPAAARGIDKSSASVWLFALRRKVSVIVGGGESKGRTLSYRNVVTAVKLVGIWKGEKMTLTIPKLFLSPPQDGLAVLVQENAYGPVIGAALVAVPAKSVGK
jgi:hypothetical protein